MLDTMTIAKLGQMSDNVLVCAVERENQIFIPSGDFELKKGDAMSFVAPSKTVG